jgi:hypothetical protein
MYNQPFSQPPGMFGAQSAMAQMQSAPSLPAGNPGAREYFNYSMATLSNAAMPRAMMPQGISSLVPQYQSGGAAQDAFSPDAAMAEAAIAAEAAQAAQDAFSPDAAMAEAAIAAEAAQAAQDAFSPDAAMAEAAIAAQAEGFDPGTSYGTSNPPPPSFLQSALNLADKYAMPSQRGPGFIVSGALGPFAFVPALVSRGAAALGLKGEEFGEFDSDVAGLSTPSWDWRTQEEIDEEKRRSTPPDTVDPDLGDPPQAPPAAAPAYVPPVYQTYAGLGLPSVSPIPPLRMVTVPISRFVV